MYSSCHILPGGNDDLYNDIHKLQHRFVHSFKITISQTTEVFSKVTPAYYCIPGKVVEVEHSKALEYFKFIYSYRQITHIRIVGSNI